MPVKRQSILILSVILVVLAVGCARAFPSNFYVSNEGKDSNDGKTPLTAWKSITKVNSQSFIAGDSVFFRRGDKWYEELQISSSGQPDKHIFFGAYGNGAKPRILGSICLTSWTNAGKQIWKSSVKTSDPSLGAPHDGSAKAYNKYPGGSWFEEKDGRVTWGHQEKVINTESDFGVLSSEYDWGWYNGHIYVFSPEDPGTRYKAMQVSQRQSCARIAYGKAQECITLKDLELMFAQSSGFYSGYPEYKASGLYFLDCHIGYIGIKGGAAAYGLSINHSDMVIRGNVINDCGRRGISYNMYRSTGLTFRNVLIENNVFYNGYHTTSIDVSSMGLDTIVDFTFRNNLVYDDPEASTTPPEGFSSNSIYIASSSKSYYGNFFIYNNIILNSKARHLLVGQVDSLYICNNTFYGLNKNARPYSMINFAANNNIIFKNNIIYGNIPRSVFEAYCMLDERGKTNFVERDYNLYYQTDSAQIFTGTAGAYYLMAGWNEYRSTFGYDKHSPAPSNPLLISPLTNLCPGDKSPARNAGISIPWIKTDFFGNTMNSPPDIGAIQSGHETRQQQEDFINMLRLGLNL